MSLSTMSAIKLLRAVGDQVRTRRLALKLTQHELGKRAGIVDRYVSAIERGTRDVPLSTLYKVVEHGLDLRLDIAFHPRGDHERSRAGLEEAWGSLSALPREVQAKVADLVFAILELA